MKSLNIGPATIGKRPVIAAVVDKRYPDHIIEDLAGYGVEILELRFDLLKCPPDEAASMARHVRTLGNYGIIGTLRETPENRDVRLEFYEAILPHVDSVDVEIVEDIKAKALAIAQNRFKIVSHHDYNSTPSSALLERLSQKAFDLGADLFKLATMAKTSRDVERLQAFCSEQSRPMVAIPMGLLGAPMRVDGFKAKSLFTYGSIDKQGVAPGQMPVSDLFEGLKKTFPSFNTAFSKTAP